MERIGELLMMTPNDEAKSLATLYFDTVLERNELYQLVLEESGTSPQQPDTPEPLRGRYLFGTEMTYSCLPHLF